MLFRSSISSRVLYYKKNIPEFRVDEKFPEPVSKGNNSEIKRKSKINLKLNSKINSNFNSNFILDINLNNEIENDNENDNNLFVSTENSTYICRERKIRVSRAAVTNSLPYVRTKSSRRKRRSSSFFVTRGITLQSIPENDEITDFDGYVYMEKTRKSNISGSDILSQLKKHF